MAKAINSRLFLGYLKSKGYDFYSGVPCSIIKKLLAEIQNGRGVEYINAVRENSALGLASGAYLAGRKSCLLMQNSGLGNIVNALTSFNLLYKIPVLMLITWRGYQGKDSPEHIIMGKQMTALLKDLGIPFKVLSLKYKQDINWAIQVMKQRSIPVAIIIKEGQLE